jgi:molybdopterin-binding protein
MGQVHPENASPRGAWLVSFYSSMRNPSQAHSSGTSSLWASISRPMRVSTSPSITNASVEDLKLAAGKEAYAIIKASDVMVGTD